MTATETNPEELQATRDAAMRATGFKAWLEYTADGRFDELRAVVKRPGPGAPGGSRFDMEAWTNYIQEKFEGDKADELVALLLQAQLEWRVDTTAVEDVRRSLEIRAGHTHDFADPSPSDARRCRYLLGRGDPDSRKCGEPTVPGTVRCRIHGGELVDSDTRRAVLMTSYLQLVEATSTAVETLVDVAIGSKNDLARVAAAKEILDRAGLTPELQVSVKFESEGRDERIHKLKDKLDTMQRGLEERAIDAVARDMS